MKNTEIEILKPVISLLPDNPGVYQYFDVEGKLLYVGKAKNLKKRVSSYFNKEHESGKLRVLVSKIHEIRYIIVDTEAEALLLENRMIKQHQPRYNVMLKDDKTYPWICIKKENFPRVFATRNVVKDGSVYFGPYASVRMMKTLLEMIRQLYKLRTCNIKLTQDQITQNKYKVCLEYHLKNCLGPCVNLQMEVDYNNWIDEIKHILKGNLKNVIIRLKDLMQNYSEQYNFEQAQKIKEKLETLDKFRSRSTVVNPFISDVDIFSFVEDPASAYVNYMKVIDGAIIQSHTIEMKKRIEEAPADLLAMAITELRERFASFSKEIIVPFEIDFNLPEINFTVPIRGDKKKLLDLSERNAELYKETKKAMQEKANPGIKLQRLLETMQKDLHLNELPIHIECFDNSNMQGTNPVASCVVFKNARPSKKEYRHFNIKTVEGPDDFASMKEIIYRRYKRLLEENQKLPQLIIVDGGKGQLSAAVSSLDELNLRGKIPIIGIAKKLEEIYFPNDSIPLYLNKNTESLKLIQFMRNEAHRFGIAFHRDKRSKEFIKSELDNIKGIGEQTKLALLQKFKTIERIKHASIDELSECIGGSKAKLIETYFLL